MYYTNVWCIGTCAQSMHSITVESIESTNVLHSHMVLTHSSNLLYIEYTGTPISIYSWHKSMHPSCPIELWHHWSRAQMYCMVQLACLYIHALFNRHHKRFDSDWMAPHTQKSTTLDLIPWLTSPVLQRLKLWVEKTILSDRSVSFVFSPILTALEWRESWWQFSVVLAVPHCILEHSTLSTSQHFHSTMDGMHFSCPDMVAPCWWCLGILYFWRTKL